MTDFWTVDRIETLRVMHHNGHTSREIGMEIGATRNQVIGKLHRLGFVKQANNAEWTPERIETLRRMYIEGATYAQIAEATGLSVSSVSQKSSRIGLPKRGTDTFRRPKNGPARKALGFKPRLVVGMQPPSIDRAASIVDVTGCRWAITPHDADKGSHMFCNHPTEANEITGHPRPYCPYHSEMNRQRPVPKAAVKRFIIPTALLRVVA